MEQVPPPFIPGAPPRKKSNTALIVSIVLACVLIPCIGLIAFGWWAKGAIWDKNVAPIATCTIGFEDVRLAIMDYAKSHDGKLPDAAKWQDSVRQNYAEEVTQSKLKDQPLFQIMDANGQWGCPPAGGAASGTGMAFNSDLSGKSLKSIDNPEDTALIFEVPNASTNAHEVFKERGKTGPAIFGTPREWLVEYVKKGYGHRSDLNVNVNSGQHREDPYDSIVNSEKSDDGGKKPGSKTETKAATSDTKSDTGSDSSGG